MVRGPLQLAEQHGLAGEAPETVMSPLALGAQAPLQSCAALQGSQDDDVGKHRELTVILYVYLYLVSHS